MRSILILALFGTLLQAGVSSAETNAECKARCSAEKASNDERCQHTEETFDTTRVRCLQDNETTYENCLKSCSQPEQSIPTQPEPSIPTQQEPTDTPEEQ